VRIEAEEKDLMKEVITNSSINQLIQVWRECRNQTFSNQSMRISKVLSQESTK
jgi:hypothetical protein